MLAVPGMELRLRCVAIRACGHCKYAIRAFACRVTATHGSWVSNRSVLGMLSGNPNLEIRIFALNDTRRDCNALDCEFGSPSYDWNVDQKAIAMDRFKVQAFIRNSHLFIQDHDKYIDYMDIFHLT